LALAQICIDVDRPVGRVDRRIFGGFSEHLGRCVYGGLFDEGSPLADARGFRSDVLDAVRALAPAHVRCPGGNFVSGYHWPDCAGPVADRPRRAELAWNAEESNRFGTDEFMAWYEAVGRGPVLCFKPCRATSVLATCGRPPSGPPRIAMPGYGPFLSYPSVKRVRSHQRLSRERTARLGRRYRRQ
jgi:hypothetical protein